MGSTSSAYRFPRGDTPHQWKLGTWAEATVPKLEDVASGYGDYITYGELAEYLFERTNVRTDQRLDYWIRHVLGMVLEYCDTEGLPALPALVVQKKTGMVGPGFSAWLPKIGLPATQEPEVLEWVAAQERLKCYRHFGAVFPPEARPTPTREYAALLNRDERSASKRSPAPEATRPGCGTVLPMSGQCDTCSEPHRITVARVPLTRCGDWRPLLDGATAVAAAVATGHTGSMDTGAAKQERVQMVLARARKIWPNDTAEEWMHGSNDVLEGARPINLVRLGRTDEVLAALEVERA